MNFGNATLLAVLGVAVVIGAVWIVRRFFSADARWHRRRRRSNTRLASNAKRPTVKFSVRTEKERRK
jgi:hypothetical protein